MWAGEWESPAPNDAKDFRLSLVLNEQHSPPFRLALLPCFMSRTGIDASEFRKRLSSATSKRKERAITLKKKKNDLISILYVRTLLSALTVVQNPLQRHFFRIGFRPTFFFFWLLLWEFSDDFKFLALSSQLEREPPLLPYHILYLSFSLVMKKRTPSLTFASRL